MLAILGEADDEGLWHLPFLRAYVTATGAWKLLTTLSPDDALKSVLVVEADTQDPHFLGQLVPLLFL